MSSSRKDSLLNLERDLPVTPEDVAALQKNRPGPPENWWEALQRLADAAPQAARDRPRPTHEGCEPFEL
jgi:hypothetical protein